MELDDTSIFGGATRSHFHEPDDQGQPGYGDSPNSSGAATYPSKKQKGQPGAASPNRQAEIETETGRELAATGKSRGTGNQSSPNAGPRSPDFKTVFLAVVALTVLAFVAAQILANYWKMPTLIQQTVIESDVWLYRLGFVIALLGKIVFGEGIGRKLAEAIRIALL